jgi:acyl-CoA thioesterase
MNDNTSPLDPQTIAERVGTGMFAEDAASQGLGMSVEAMGPGYARLSMNVRPDMLNGFKICHGGFITTLADSAFAFACNSANQLTLAAAITVDFIAPAREGDRLTAEAKELTLAGRTGIYDVKVVNQRGETIALLRGRSHRLKDKQVVPM